MSPRQFVISITLITLFSNCRPPSDRIMDEFKKVDSSLKASNKEILDTLQKSDSSYNIANGFMEAIQNGTFIEGKFVRLEKINARDYKLYVQTGKSGIVSFYTIMPLDSLEISHLKKNGVNIRLTYTEFKNPVTKRTDSIVKFMEPVYGFGK